MTVEKLVHVKSGAERLYIDLMGVNETRLKETAYSKQAAGRITTAEVQIIKERLTFLFGHNNSQSGNKNGANQ